MKRLSISRGRLALGGTLFGLFVAAFAVRLYGINFGLPYAEEIDEPAIMDLALRMLQAGDWNPHWFSYPTLYIYLQGAIIWVYSQWAQAQGLFDNIQQMSGVYTDFRLMPHPDIYLWGRAASAFIGAITVPALYAAGRQLYGKAVGLVAAALFAFTFLHVQYSHWIRTDIPMTLFVTLVLLFSARVLKEGRGRDYLLAGICGGLAVGSKYNGFPIAATLGVAHLAYAYRQLPPEARSLRRYINPRSHLPLLLGLLGALVGFVATNPFILTNFDEYRYWVTYDSTYYTYLGPRLETAWYYLSYFSFREGFGLILTPLALLGLAIALVRRRGEDWTTFVFPLIYFAFLLPWRNTNIRSALPLTPFLAIFAAMALVAAIGWLAKHWSAMQRWTIPVTASLTLILVLMPANKIFAEDAHMAAPSTRALATEWAQANLPAGARVLSEGDGIRLNPPIIQLGPNQLTTRYINALAKNDIDYVVAVDFPPPEKPRPFSDILTLVKDFPPPDWSKDYLIRIYRVRPEPLPLELVDAKLDRTRAAPGEQSRLTLHWQASGTFDTNHTEFVRLIGSDNSTAFELAEAPQQGIGKMKKWPVGRVITDTHTLSLPQDLGTGQYQVQVGFYRAETKYALTLKAPTGEDITTLSIGSFTVAPHIPPAGQPETHMDVRLDPLQLNGYSIAQKTFSPGQPLDLKLFWSAITVPTVSYTRFVHLLDAQGKLIAQEDIIPYNGSYPTTLWEANTVVEDSAHLTLPPDLPPGQYAVETGWYNSATKERLRTASGDDAAVLQNVVIGK